MTYEDYLDGRRKLRCIQRFSMEAVIKPQNLCDHGYNVATMFYVVMKSMGESVSAETIFYVLQHDFVEHITGDLNVLVKTYNPETSEAWGTIEDIMVPAKLMDYTDSGLKRVLTPIEHKVFKFCDSLVAWIYCLEEKSLGNTNLSNAIRYYGAKLHDSAKTHKVLEEILEQTRGRFMW